MKLSRMCDEYLHNYGAIYIHTSVWFKTKDPCKCNLMNGWYGWTGEREQVEQVEEEIS